MYKNVILIGPMGAGKTTIGRLLAAKLHFEFIDSDHIIEERTGANIPWIFDVEGEEGFRKRETAILEEVITLDKTVIATGGGIVVKACNREILKSADAVIYLTATIDQLVSRTSKDKKRPLLQVDNPREKIISLFNERDPLYRESATHTILTDQSSPKLVVQKILDAI